MVVRKKDKPQLPLTIKQRKLVKGIAEGKTQRQSAKEAGLNETYACDILKKPEVKRTLVELMDKHGLGDDVLLDKHKELLCAEEKTVAATALKMAYQLKSAFVERKEHTFPGGIDVKIQFVRPDGS